MARERGDDHSCSDPPRRVRSQSFPESPAIVHTTEGMVAILELERSLDAVLSAPGPSKHAEALNALSWLRSYIGKSDSDADGEADSDTEAMALHCARLLFRQHTFPAHDAAENAAASRTDFAVGRPKRNRVHLRVGHYLRTSVASVPSAPPSGVIRSYHRHR